MLKIVIWDEDGPRSNAISVNLHKALKHLNMKAHVACQSEPPLISRMLLTGRTPLLEIQQQYWSCGEDTIFSCEQLINLLKRF